MRFTTTTIAKRRRRRRIWIRISGAEHGGVLVEMCLESVDCRLPELRTKGARKVDVVLQPQRPGDLELSVDLLQVLDHLEELLTVVLPAANLARHPPLICSGIDAAAAV